MFLHDKVLQVLSHVSEVVLYGVLEVRLNLCLDDLKKCLFIKLELLSYAGGAEVLICSLVVVNVLDRVVDHSEGGRECSSGEEELDLVVGLDKFPLNIETLLSGLGED